MTSRTRRAVAVLCIGLVVFAAFAPAAVDHFSAVLVSLGVIDPPPSSFAPGTVLASGEQPLLLASGVSFRGPPRSRLA
jgi:hypothetical protein